MVTSCEVVFSYLQTCFKVLAVDARCVAQRVIEVRYWPLNVHREH